MNKLREAAEYALEALYNPSTIAFQHARNLLIDALGAQENTVLDSIMDEIVNINQKLDDLWFDLHIKKLRDLSLHDKADELIRKREEKNAPDY